MSDDFYRQIGRKIRIRWGTRPEDKMKSVALEKTPRLVVPDNAPLVQIYDVFELMGEVTERLVGPANNQGAGRTIGDYFTDDSFWMTAEEAEALWRAER